MFFDEYIILKGYENESWLDFMNPFRDWIEDYKEDYPELYKMLMANSGSLVFAYQGQDFDYLFFECYGLIPINRVGNDISDAIKAIYENGASHEDHCLNLFNTSKTIVFDFIVNFIFLNELEQKAKIYNAIKALLPNSRGEEVTEYTPQVKRKTKVLNVTKQGYNSSQGGLQNQSAGAQAETESGDIAVTGTDTTKHKLSAGQTIADLYAEMEAIKGGIFKQIYNRLKELTITKQQAEEYPYNCLKWFYIS